jgi:LysM repeat protein
MTYVRVGANTLASKRAGSQQSAVTSDSPAATVPYQVTIAQRDPPHHAVSLALHDKAPTPSDGGGGWEEVSLPRRPAVLIWKGRGLMKMSMSVVLDRFREDVSVYDGAYRTLTRFWRPEGSSNSDTVEPSVLTLASSGDVVPYKNLKWVLETLEWGEAQGNDEGVRSQQVLVLTFVEFRADVRLKPGSPKKTQRTQPYKVKKGETLASIARKYGISTSALGALQKPPIKDSRNVVGKTIVVPVGKHATSKK